MSSPGRVTIGRSLRHSLQAFRVAAEEGLSSLDMSLPLANVLIDLFEEDGISSAELSRRVSVTAQTMTHLVSGLAERGLIERRRHRSHGRILTVHLTPKGRRVVAGCITVLAAVERRMLKDFSPAEGSQLTAYLARCTDALTPGSG